MSEETNITNTAATDAVPEVETKVTTGNDSKPMESKTLHRNDWIKFGIFGLLLGVLITWGALFPKLSPSSLSQAVRITQVVSQSATYGYITANKAELVPSNITEVVTVVTNGIDIACLRITSGDIKIPEVKNYLSFEVNKFIDEKLGGSQLYKTLADAVITAGISAAEDYVNKTKADAEDYVKILTALREGIVNGTESAVRFEFPIEVDAIEEIPAATNTVEVVE